MKDKFYCDLLNCKECPLHWLCCAAKIWKLNFITPFDVLDYFDDMPASAHDALDMELIKWRRSLGLPDNEEELSDNKEELSDSVKCPYCGASYYREGPSTCTLVYEAPVIKDGHRLINHQVNTTTTEYECLNCGRTFVVKRN